MRSAAGRFVQVMVSVPSTAVAARISEALLDGELCACAQTLGPITSRYRWKGELERSREWLLVLKTRTALLKKLETAVLELHPYDVPEILAVPVSAGHGPYLRWLEESTRAGTGRRRARRA